VASNADFGPGALGWIDRGCWLALSQDELGTWSWPKAIATFVIAAIVGVVVYATAFEEPAFLVGLAVAYALVYWRARSAYEHTLTRR
jgi:hypothetical protein